VQTNNLGPEFGRLAGGAINLITRRGTGPLEGELEASGGSYGNWSGEGSLAGLLHRSARTRLQPYQRRSLIS